MIIKNASEFFGSVFMYGDMFKCVDMTEIYGTDSLFTC